MPVGAMNGTILLADTNSRRGTAAVAAVVVLLSEVSAMQGAPALSVAAVVALVVVALLAWLGFGWRQHLAWLVLLCACSVALAAVHPGPAAYFALFMALTVMGARGPVGVGLPIVVVTLVAFESISLLHFRTDALSIGLTLITFAFAYGGGYGLKQLREEQARTRAALEELQASRQAQLESAKVQERARLAREIHDVLAHTLSALSVQLEGARLLLEQRPGDPE